MSLKTPLGRVLGLGAAPGGSHHWWVQRLSAVALVPLTLWFVVALLALPDLGYATVHGWLAAPGHALPVALLVLSATYHAELGVAVVIEDYVSREAGRTATLVLARLAHVAVGAAALFAVLKVALGSAA